MIATIICIGNRFISTDAAGLDVYDTLQKMSPLPYKIDIVEGGMAGLNLLPLLERGGRVIFVDAVAGFTEPDQIVLLTEGEIKEVPEPVHFGHEAGLAYLLRLLPRVCEVDPPEEIVLVGLEGVCTAQTVERAARLSINLAAHGLQDIR